MASCTHERPIERLLARLQGVRGAGQDKWTAKCPAHDDRHSSLSIRVGMDNRAVMFCHAKCTVSAVVAALSLTMGDLFVGPPVQAAGHNTPLNGSAPKAQGVETRTKMVKTYDYHDANHTLLYQVCRMEPKAFPQRRPTGDGRWEWGLGDIEPVLYRLPELIEAAAQGKRICVVEGEKDVDTLASSGYPATTSPMGAGKWHDRYAAELAKTSVVVIPDNDDTGRAHAQTVANSLFAHGCSVKVVELPGAGAKGDVTEWLDDGHDLDELESLIGQTPSWRPAGPRQTRWTLRELWENDIIMRPPPPVVPRLAWAGRSTLLAGREKSGKSTLIAYIAAQVTRGGQFLGDPCAAGDVLLVGLEEYIGDTARKLRHFGADENRLSIVDGWLGDPRERPRELAGHIEATKPVLVAIDSLSAYSHGQVQSEYDPAQMTAVVQPLSDLAHTSGVALVIVAHARKSDGRARGSTAITAGTDIVCEFFAPDEDTDPTLRKLRSAGRVPVQPVLEMRFDGDHYSAEYGGSAPISTLVMATVGNRPGCSINDVVQAVGRRRDDTAREIHRMLAAGLILNLGSSRERAKLALPGALHPDLSL